MLKPNIKYRVTLAEYGRKTLQNLVRTGNTAAYRTRHAQILLALDERPENEPWADEKIRRAYGPHIRTIGNIRKRFVEEGMQAALERKASEHPPFSKIDGEAEAKIIALTCSQPPEGYCRWTLKLIANKVVELGILDSISDHGIGDLLKKTTFSHGYRRNGA
jgi:transposase